MGIQMFGVMLTQQIFKGSLKELGDLRAVVMDPISATSARSRHLQKNYLHFSAVKVCFCL
jgi:hypothetical protein